MSFLCISLEQHNGSALHDTFATRLRLYCYCHRSPTVRHWLLFHLAEPLGRPEQVATLVPLPPLCLGLTRAGPPGWPTQEDADLHVIWSGVWKGSVCFLKHCGLDAEELPGVVLPTRIRRRGCQDARAVDHCSQGTRIIHEGFVPRLLELPNLYSVAWRVHR